MKLHAPHNVVSRAWPGVRSVAACVCTAVGCVCWASPVSGQVLVTTDGRAIVGTVRFDPDGKVAAKPADGLTTRVDVSELVFARMNSQPKAKPPTDTNLPLGEGLLGRYFASDKPEGKPVRETIDPQIGFDWGGGSPAGLPPDGFSVQWVGQVLPQFTQNYSFFTTSDDGVRLWVDGKLLIDQWGPQSGIEYVGKIDLIADKRVPIRLDYFEATGGANVKLEWAAPGLNRELVPTGRCFAASATGSSMLPQAMRIITRDGLQTPIASLDGIDDVAVRVSIAGGKRISVPRDRTAAVWVRTPASSAAAGQTVPGVVLSNGDTFPGRIHQLKGDRVNMESELYGWTDFDLYKEVVGLVFGPPGRMRRPVVVTLDDSMAFPTELPKVSGGQLRMSDRAFGDFSVPVDRVVGIRRDDGESIWFDGPFAAGRGEGDEGLGSSPTVEVPAGHWRFVVLATGGGPAGRFIAKAGDREIASTTRPANAEPPGQGDASSPSVLWGEVDGPVKLSLSTRDQPADAESAVQWTDLVLVPLLPPKPKE